MPPVTDNAVWLELVTVSEDAVNAPLMVAEPAPSPPPVLILAHRKWGGLSEPAIQTSKKNVPTYSMRGCLLK
jgi:hypothetical protein